MQIAKNALPQTVTNRILQTASSSVGDEGAGHKDSTEAPKVTDKTPGDTDGNVRGPFRILKVVHEPFAAIGAQKESDGFPRESGFLKGNFPSS